MSFPRSHLLPAAFFSIVIIILAFIFIVIKAPYSPPLNFVTPFGVVCDQHQDISSVTDYSTSNKTIHPIIAYSIEAQINAEDRDHRSDAYWRGLYKEWEPKTIEEVELVACFYKSYVIVDTCWYTTIAGNGQVRNFLLELEQVHVLITLKSAYTGGVIDSTEIIGDVRVCGSTNPSEINLALVTEFLQPYVLLKRDK